VEEIAEPAMTEGSLSGHMEGQAPLDAEQAREATARMFRSVRFGRSWVRARGSTLAAGQSAHCVLMKPGNDEPSVFLIPGAPGSILQLGPLAAALPVAAPVYAITPRGIEEGETPCDSVAAMAQHAAGVIESVQPGTPYSLVGYSAGGLVALEIARQSADAGREVPLVVLLDSYPGKQFWPLVCHAEIIVRQTVRALWSLRRYTQARHEALRRIRTFLEYLAESGVKVVPPPPVMPEGWSAASRRVHVASYNACEAYRPAPYAGRVVFVQPEKILDLEPRSPTRVWGRFLSDLEVRRVPGSHLSMVDDTAAAVAAVLGACLQTAVRQSAARRICATGNVRREHRK
jgi:thioesterase domain-containing protein